MSIAIAVIVGFVIFLTLLAYIGFRISQPEKPWHQPDLADVGVSFVGAIIGGIALSVIIMIVIGLLYNALS